MQGHLLYELCARSHAAVELRAIRQGRECLSEVACGVAVEVPLAAKPGPTGEDGEGDDLAFGEGWLGAGLPSWPMGLAEVVHHDVKCGKEGVHIDHKSSVPFPSGSVSKPTLVYGHLPLKSSTGNSHQAFKVEREPEERLATEEPHGRGSPSRAEEVSLVDNQQGSHANHRGSNSGGCPAVCLSRLLPQTSAGETTDCSGSSYGSRCGRGADTCRTALSVDGLRRVSPVQTGQPRD